MKRIPIPDAQAPGTETNSRSSSNLGAESQQLSLPFGGEGAPDPVSVASRSRRELRHEQAPRAVRAERLEHAPQPIQEERFVYLAIKPYLPPGKLLEVVLTENNYSIVSVRRRQEGYQLRVHRMFLDASQRIMRALARYVVHNDRRASRLIGEYIDANQHIIKSQPRRPRRATIRTEGRFHDLQSIFDRLNRERFGGKLDARITWGPAVHRGRRRRSIKMGSYAVEDRLIRIHPALDQSVVPEYFVAWIVYHEMLHGKHEVRRECGRRRFHTPEFIREERSFIDYERAHAWEKQNLDRLLRA